MNLYVNTHDAIPKCDILKTTAENILVDENYDRMHINAQVRRYVVITETDTSSSMNPIIMDWIFEAFFTTKELGSGTGSYLSSVLGIIKNNGSFINVHSEEKKAVNSKFI